MGNSVPLIISEKILEEFISSGLLKPGDKLPTVRELADRYAPISNNTLVHALAILESSGWISKRRGSGCFVADKTTRDNARQSNLIGCVVPSMQNKIILDLHAGIDNVCKMFGTHVLMSAITNESVEEEKVQLRRMVSAGCSSVILYPVVRNIEQLADDYLAREFRDVTIVLVDMAYPEMNRPRVIFDNDLAGFEMTSHLVKKGHKNIAFMCLEKSEPEVVSYSVSKRNKGFRDAIACYAAAGVTGSEWSLAIPPSKELHIWAELEYNLEGMLHDSLLKWKQMENRPTAVIAINDDVAYALVNVARVMDIDITEDLTVVGFDNLLPAAYPPFTTTNPDFFRMGQIAAHMVWRNASSLNQPLTYVLPVPILERQYPDISRAMSDRSLQMQGVGGILEPSI